jgi:hypothetical protein
VQVVSIPSYKPINTVAHGYNSKTHTIKNKYKQINAIIIKGIPVIGQ